MVNETELEPVRLMTRLITMCHECRSNVFARLTAILATGTRHDRAWC